MRKLNKLIKLMVFCGALFMVSCETTDLDLAQNPNALSPEQANPDFFLNAIQVNFAYFVESMGSVGAQVTRIDYMYGRDYTNAFSPTGFDGIWRSAYQSMMMDIKTMNTLADEGNLVHHKAVGEVIQAYVMMTLVDFFGDVPYTEALMGADNLNPAADSGASIYAAAITLLDDAIANFNATATADPALDFYYDGDWAQWIKAANTLKMKAYIATRLVDGSAVANFNAIVASGNYISSNADDFQFRWGTNEIQPDTRHPRYSASYTTTGGTDYMSNWLMDTMRGEYPDLWLDWDPRIFYYFYRQVSETPGIDGPADEEVLECGLYSPPAHYAGFVYCGNPYGWWGRDHGNDNGIPPDGFLRTLSGVYPAGGAMDDWSFSSKVNGDGNGGNGVTPIMLASWTDFMIAELRLASGDVAGAKTATFDGINKSLDKVTSFAVPTDRFTAITDFYYGGIDTMIYWFLSDTSDKWDAAADKMDVLGEQYFVASFGNGIDAYNFYRRTGYPTTLQPNIEPNPGGFIRSFFYPASYANTNANATQKSGVDVQVFWDTNPASPGFPSSN